jgi:hypothetical protein
LADTIRATAERTGPEAMTLDRVFVKLTREQITSLLTGLAVRLGGGLTQERARQFEAELQRLPAHDDRMLEVAVLVAGIEHRFVLDVFGGENEALDAAFLVPAIIARVVVEELQRLFDKVPIRHLAAMPEA